jgi:hypothetical protein
MHDSPEPNAKSMPFHCQGCRTPPACYRRGRFIVMGCRCGAVTWDYVKLPSIPQTDREWSQWLASLAWPDLDVSDAAVGFEGNNVTPA